MVVQIGGVIINASPSEPDGRAAECTELEKIEISLLLKGIFQFYGMDFRNYIFSSVRRRIWNRIRAEKVHSVSALQAKVLHDPEAMKRLFEELSINVTEMFRDPSTFVSFRNTVIPLLKDQPSVRIWHAGCSTGEEVYSMAILLYEEGLLEKTTIYATDMNDNLLITAKEGTFPIKKMQSYTKNYISAGGAKAFSEYYSASNDKVYFHRFLSENIVFAQHNLATDCSFNEFHVIICRNVLIYFDGLLQERVHKLFFESLCTNGFLVLGSKEGITSSRYSQFYEAVDPKERIFQRHE